jgi:hypothetical protein
MLLAYNFFSNLSGTIREQQANKGLDTESYKFVIEETESKPGRA